MSNKREKDRESGTGQPIKSIPKKGGQGKGNWGADAEAIADGIKENQGGNVDGKKAPNSFADLNDRSHEEGKNEDSNVSYEEWAKENMPKKEIKAFKQKTVKSTFRRKAKVNKYEKQTDLMFGPTKPQKKKTRNKKKKQKVLLETDVFFGAPEKGSDDRPRGRGRGRGGGRGRGRGDSTRGGGYQRRGDRGGYGRRGGGGYGRGGGFGSRGRGYASNNYDNQQNMQNNNEYQGGNNRGNGQSDNRNAPISTQ